MMKTNLPPQAYTREVFSNAYDWLQSQSRSIKELAQTPDDLVALYLQARRHGHLSDSSGKKSFKNDLKNLAEGLRQFDESQAPSASAVTEKITETTKHSFTFNNPTQKNAPDYEPHQTVAEPTYSIKEETPLTAPEDYNFAPQAAEEPIAPPQQPAPEPHFQPTASPQPAPAATAAPHQQPITTPPDSEKTMSNTGAEVNLTNLDSKSKEILLKAKMQLNLSRDEEVLRMLLVLGQEKLKDILPS